MSNYKIETYRYGTKRYYLNNKLHREDGPAIILADGSKFWYKNGELHREEGPASEWNTGEKDWYLDGKCYGYDNEFTNESWLKFIKTLIFS